MRRRMASSGICMSVPFRHSQYTANQVTEPHGNHAENDGKDDVPARVKPLAVLEQVQSLQTEGGKRGVTAADAGDEQLRREGARLRGHFAFRRGERAEK